MSSGSSTASVAISSAGASAAMEGTPASSGPAAAAHVPAPLPDAPILSPQELSNGLRDLTNAVAGIQATLQELLKPGRAFAPPPPPPPPSAAPFIPPPSPPPAAVASQQGVPITQVKFPPSPSPLPAWLDPSASGTAPGQQPAPPPPAPYGAAFGGFAGYGEPYSSMTLPACSPTITAAALGRPEGAYAAVSRGQKIA